MIPGQSGLDVEREEQIISEALSILPTVQQRVLKDKVTRDVISQALVDDQYHILHFIGHGTFDNDDGKLVLNSENGGRDLISAPVFADFFRNYPSLKLVVLNACQGAEVSATRPLAGMAPQLVARGIPAVVAKQYPTALTFAKEFYLKLCSGWNRGQVDSAISHARNRINMDVREPMAFATPVLFLRSPTGVIFDFETKQGLLSRFSRLFSSAQVKQVNRLKEVKKTYEKNIEAWQAKTNDANAETRKEATEAVALEQLEMAAVEQRIVQWNRAFLASIFVTALIFVLGYAGLFNVFGADDRIESRFIPYMEDYVVKKFNPKVRLIMSDEGINGELGEPGPSWRTYHADLIDALAGKAKVIVFDLSIAESDKGDEKMAAAIERAKGKGTQVILGKRVRDDGVLISNLPVNLRNAVDDRWGNIDVVGQHWGFVRVYQLAQSGAEHSAAVSVPSLALQAVTHFLDYHAIQLDEQNDRIHLSNGTTSKSIPVYQTNQNVYDLPYGMVDYGQIKDATRSYREVYSRLRDADYLTQFNGTVVIVGYKTPGELFTIAHGQRRYGAEIHANVVSDILSDIYVRWLPPAYDFLIVAILATLGALVRARLADVLTTRIPIPFTEPRKTFSIPALLFVVDALYLMTCFLFYKFELIYILKTYHLFTPFVAYWLTGKMRRRVALKPTREVS